MKLTPMASLGPIRDTLHRHAMKHWKKYLHGCFHAICLTSGVIFSILANNPHIAGITTSITTVSAVYTAYFAYRGTSDTKIVDTELKETEEKGKD